MKCDPEATDPINSYALVSYIPGSIGDFITDLRQELVETCVARSHVSILPPRSLDDPQAAAEQVRSIIETFSPFELDMPKIGTFKQTAVIFCEIGRGREQLVELHAAMNTGALYFDEPFDYHPHVTLAQGFPVEQLFPLLDRIQERWLAAPSTQVLIENVTFVQNTAGNIWLDLEESWLRGLAGVPR